MKIDFYGQAGLVLVLLILVLLYPMFPSVMFYVKIVLIPLAFWQLISAGIHTRIFADDKVKIARLKTYWKYAIICIGLFTASYLINKIMSAWSTVTLILFIISLVGSIVVSTYYLFIYKKYLLKHDK